MPDAQEQRRAAEAVASRMLFLRLSRARGGVAPQEVAVSKREVENLKVYPVGGQLVLHVPRGRGEELRIHLAAHGIRSKVSPAAETPYERLEVFEDMDPETLQAIVDEWEQ